MQYKLVESFDDEDQEANVEAYVKSSPSNLWFVVNYAEDGAYIYECPTKIDAEKLLTNFHTEGSHTDNDTYEVWHNGKQQEYEIKATIK